MTLSEIELPSNKKFGFFFTFVFALVAAYFYDDTNTGLTYIFGATSSILLVITGVKAEILLPLNKLWMRFGFLLGMVVSPIVFGTIFFGLFTPIAFIMRLSGRDELRITFRKKSSHWISRNAPIKPESFKNQF